MLSKTNILKISNIRKNLTNHLFLFGFIFTVILSNNVSRASSETKPEYIIVDTDMVGDDAWALQMLLNAEKKLKTVKVLAITIVNGNTDWKNAIKNTYKMLVGANRTDIPIYKGATEGIIPLGTVTDTTYGTNGFSDINIWKSSYPNDINSIIQQKNAVEAIRDLIMQHPHKISLFSIAPLTNIALAIKTYPEILENIKRVYTMGGNYKARGNQVPGVDINFYLDPEAAYIVLNSLKQPIILVPSEISDSIHVTMDWRFNVLAKFSDANVQLLNAVDEIAYKNKTNFIPFDAVLPAVFLFPKRTITAMKPYHALVELQGMYARGEMIVDVRNTNYNVYIIEKVSNEAFKQAMLETASAF